MGTRYIGLGKESSFGTAVAATEFLEARDRIAASPGLLIPNPVASRFRKKKNFGKFRVRGNLDFLVEPENCGLLMLGVQGEVDTTFVVSGVYNHRFRAADTLPSLTVRKGVELDEEIYVGMLVNSLRFRFAHGEDVAGTAELVGPAAAVTTGTIGTPTFSSLDAFVFHQASIKIATVESKQYVEAGEITVNNQIPLERGTMGNKYFTKKRYGFRVVNGTLTIFFDTVDERDRFLAGTEFDLDVQFTGPTAGDGQKYYLQLKCLRCVYREDAMPHVVSQSEPLVINAPFEALWYDSSVRDLEIYLQNKVSAY